MLYDIPLSRLQACNKSHTVPSDFYYMVGRGRRDIKHIIITREILVFYAIYSQLALVLV